MKNQKEDDARAKLIGYLKQLKQFENSDEQGVINGFINSLQKNPSVKVISIARAGIKSLRAGQEERGIKFPTWDLKDNKRNRSQVEDTNNGTYDKSLPDENGTDLKVINEDQDDSSEGILTYQNKTAPSKETFTDAEEDINKAYRTIKQYFEHKTYVNSEVIETCALGVVDAEKIGCSIDDFYLETIRIHVEDTIKSGDEITLTGIRSLSYTVKSVQEKQKKTFERARSLLTQGSLFNRCLNFMTSRIVGNEDILKNVLIDIVLSAANPIEIGSKNETYRKIRAQNAIILCGPAESGKSRICDLIADMVPEAEVLSALDYQTLKSTLLRKIHYNIVILREAEAILDGLTSSKGAKKGNKLIPALREIIEDQSFRWQQLDMRYGELNEMAFPVFCTFVFATVHEPTEAQIATRFKIYKLDSSFKQTAEVLDSTFKGITHELPSADLTQEEIQFMFRLLRHDISNCKGVRITQGLKEIINNYKNRMLWASIDTDTRFTWGNTTIDKETFYLRYGEQLSDEFIEFASREIVDSDSATKMVKRKFEDVLRYIAGHTYLHFYQREHDGGYVIARKEDVGSAEWIVRSFEDKLLAEANQEESQKLLTDTTEEKTETGSYTDINDKNRQFAVVINA